jgi:hypothetical protein
MIDALMAQPHRRLIAEPVVQMPADPLRAPPLPKQLPDETAQDRIRVQPTTVLTSPSERGMTVRLERPIPTTGCVATKLARHRRRRTTQPTGDLP